MDTSTWTGTDWKELTLRPQKAADKTLQDKGLMGSIPPVRPLSCEVLCRWYFTTFQNICRPSREAQAPNW